jgi:hypothetical protein
MLTSRWAPGGLSGVQPQRMFQLLVLVAVSIILTIFAEPTLAIPNTTVLSATACACVAIFIWQMWHASAGVMRFVFLALAAHAIFGFATAEPSTYAIVSGTLDDRSYALSLAVIASGLLAAAFAFSWGAPSRKRLVSVDSGKLLALATSLTLCAAVTIVWLCQRNNLLPWQNDILKMGNLRYEVGGVDEWLMNRSTDILTLTVPLVFLLGRWKKIVSGIGFAALGVTFKRAPLLSVVLVVMLAHVIRTGRVRRLAAVALLAVCVYIGSQLFYFGLLGDNVFTQKAYVAMASGLPEVRDLGWILWLNGGRLHYGSTLVQPILPIPTLVSPWIKDHSLRALTTKMIGKDWEEMGGLRITLAGEGYLNFGAVGAIALCGIWGWGMRKVSGLIEHAARAESTPDAYIAAVLTSWLAFWLYLGGSQASGVVKSSVLVLVALFYFARRGHSSADSIGHD